MFNHILKNVRSIFNAKKPTIIQTKSQLPAVEQTNQDEKINVDPIDWDMIDNLVDENYNAWANREQTRPPLRRVDNRLKIISESYHSRKIGAR